MALVKCKECGEKVSTKAKTCPNCGAKAPKKTSLFTWMVLIFIIFVVYAVSKTPSPSTSSSSPSPSKILSKSNSSNSSSSAVKAVQKPQWGTSTSTDEMSGKYQAFASSPTVFPTKQMDFPYSDVKAWLGVGCDGSSEWAYIGFTKSPNLLDTETEDGYNRIETRIKWDNSIQNVTLIQEWGASFLHFQNDRDAISKMASANSGLLELRWHGQGAVYFKFSLDGSSGALKSMRAKCGG